MSRGAISPSSSCQTVRMRGRRPSGVFQLTVNFVSRSPARLSRVADFVTAPVFAQHLGQRFPTLDFESEFRKEPRFVCSVPMLGIEQVFNNLPSLHQSQVGFRKHHDSVP